METPIVLALAITALPLAAFVIQVFWGRFLPRQGDWLPTLAVGGGLAMSVFLMVTEVLGHAHGLHPVTWSVNWFSIGETSPLTIDFDVYLDNLSVIMLFVVTLVSFLVHLFSMGYMHGEERYNRFYAYLALFTFSMLGLVITSNLLFLFIFWELVGVCSYFLIGFYFQKDTAAAACKKAFLTNRIGDTFFFLGIMMILSHVGSLRFSDIYASVNADVWESSTLTMAGLFCFLGAVSKSAQFPLHVWLPDAMEGPTPVSALIHAATMVAAGVYMVCRMFPFLVGIDAETGQSAMLSGDYFSSDALFVIAMVGGFTAIFAATIAIPQNDIKKVLAYSTVSQLGYMIMGVGVGSMSAAMFHLFTHAMFKACLFLGSGSVIHAMHHEQDMRKMGGLRKKLPITHLTFVASTCALAGFPLFSGAISKEAILTQAFAYWSHHGTFAAGLPFIMCLVAAALTSFYMFRLVIGIFYGKPRDQHAYEHAHESPKTMTIPLMTLGLMGVFGAGIAIPFVGPGIHWFDHVANPEVIVGGMMTDDQVVADAGVRSTWSPDVSPWHDAHAHDEPDAAAFTPAVVSFWEDTHHAHWPVFFMATLCGVGGFLLALLIFGKLAHRDFVGSRGFLAGWKTALMRYYWVDEFYNAVPIAFTHWMSRLCLRIDKMFVDGIVNAWGVLAMIVAWFVGKVDYHGVDGAVRGTCELTLMTGRKVKSLQTGRIQDYVGLTVFCMTLVFIVVMTWVAVD